MPLLSRTPAILARYFVILFTVSVFWPAFCQNNFVTIFVSRSIREGEGLLTNVVKVRLQLPRTNDTVIQLSAVPNDQVQLPVGVTITAGQFEAAVPITPTDDTLLDGPQIVTISGTTPGLTVSSKQLTVLDNETASLGIEFPSDFTEGQIGSARVTSSRAPDRNVVVQISSLPAGRLAPPATVTLLAGQTNVSFNVPSENAWLDGTITASLSASVENWSPSTAQFTFHDNESTNIVVTLPASAGENAGVLTNVGRIVFGGLVASNMDVALAGTPPERLSFPGTVTVLAGQSNALFSVTVLDNTAPEGTIPVVVTASRPGFQTGQATINILDDDPAYYVFNTVPSPQFVGVGFTNIVRALDVNHQQLVVGTFGAQLSLESAGATNALGSISITNGQANLSITSSAPMFPGKLVAAGRGARGESGPFNILQSLSHQALVPVRDVVWDDSSRTLYAAVPDSAPVQGGTISTVEIATGNVVAWTTVPGGISAGITGGGRIAQTPDRSRLLIASGSGTQIQAWDTQTRGLSNTYTFPNGQAVMDFAAAFASPWRVTLAMSAGGFVQTPIILNEFLAPLAAPSGRWIRSVVSDPILPETFYEFRAYQVSEWKTGPTGFISERALRQGPYRDEFLPMTIWNGKLFCGDGFACSLQTAEQIGSLNVPSPVAVSPRTGLVATDAVRQQILVASPGVAGTTRLQSFDAQDLQLRRDILIPMSLSNPQRMLFAGSNTVALVANDFLGLIQWPVTAAGSAVADLAVKASPINSNPYIGTNWDWLVSVTNKGITKATDVLLRCWMPTNSTVVASTINTGRVSLLPRLLEVWVPEIPPGTNITLSLSIVPEEGGATTNLFTVTANEDDPNLSDNQTNVVSFISPSGTIDSVESVRLAVRELSYDTTGRTIYALERTSATNQTALFRLDASSLQPVLLRMLPGVATHLRLSGDNRFLYATDHGGRGVLRIDLNAAEPDLQFETFNPPGPWSYAFLDMQVDPGDSRTLVTVARSELPPGANYQVTLACFKDGSILPRTNSLYEFTSTPSVGNVLEADAATRMAVFGRKPYLGEVRRFRLSSDGLDLENTYLRDGPHSGFEIVDGKLYTRLGDELMETTGRRLRSLPAFPGGYGLINYAGDKDRLFLTQSDPTGTSQVQVFDRLTFARLGTIGLGSPALVDSSILLPDSRLVLATADNHVLVVSDRLIGGTASADLGVQVVFQPARPKVNETVQISITITNKGPSTSTAPGITLETPTAFVRDSLTPAPASSTGNGLFPYPLLWTTTNLPPGRSRLFQATGHFAAAGTMKMAVGVADRADDPARSDNRAEFFWPVAYQLSASQGALLSSKTLDAIYDPTRNAILAIFTGDDDLAGKLVAVSITNGLVLGSWDVGTSPTTLALADDAQTLYVATDNGITIERLNLSTMQIQALLPAAPDTALDSGVSAIKLAVNPLSPSQLVARRSDGKLSLYSADSFRHNASNYFGYDSVFFAPDRLITPKQSTMPTLDRFRISGLSLLADGSGGLSPVQGLRAGGGFIFTQEGQFIDPLTFSQIGQFAGNGPAVFNPSVNLVFYPGSNPNGHLRSFDLDTQAIVKDELIGATLGQTPVDMFSAGEDLLVTRYNSGDMVVIRTGAISSGTGADLAIGVSSMESWKAGLVCEWVVNVTNLGPGLAAATRVDMRMPTGMYFVAATTPALSASEPQASVLAGDLQPGQSTTVRVQAIAQMAAISDELVVSTRSLSPDPQLTNNTARIARPIQPCQVPNRVDFLSLSASNLLYDPISQKMFLACPALQQGVTNKLVVFDPSIGVIERQVSLPGVPGRLAVSAGGEFLYISLDGASQVLRLVLPSLETNLLFATLRDDLNLPRPDCDMAVLPGRPNSLVFSRFGGGTPSPAGVWIYDDDRPRTNSVPGGYNGITFIDVGTSPGTIVGLDYLTARFRTIAVNASGLVAQAPTGDQAPWSYSDFAVAGTNLLIGDSLFNPLTFLRRASLSSSFSAQASALSSTGDRAVLTAGSNRAQNPIDFAGYRTDTAALVGSNQIGGLPVSMQKLILWGTDGVAAIGGGQLLIGRLDLARPPSGDADADGMPDDWETQHGLNPNTSDAAADPDLDGASNLTEYLAGTDPQSSQSAPRIQATVIGSQLRLIFPCVGGRHFYIERSVTLAPASWVSVFDSISSGGMQMYNVGSLGTGRAYFRIRITP